MARDIDIIVRAPGVTVIRPAAPTRATAYGIRRNDGAWWSSLFGRFIHVAELPEPEQLSLVAAQFHSMTGANLYGLNLRLDLVATWEAQPLPTYEGVDARPAVKQ